MQHTVVTKASAPGPCDGCRRAGGARSQGPGLLKVPQRGPHLCLQVQPWLRDVTGDPRRSTAASTGPGDEAPLPQGNSSSPEPEEKLRPPALLYPRPASQEWVVRPEGQPQYGSGCRRRHSGAASPRGNGQGVGLNCDPCTRTPQPQKGDWICLEGVQLMGAGVVQHEQYPHRDTQREEDVETVRTVPTSQGQNLAGTALGSGLNRTWISTM